MILVAIAEAVIAEGVTGVRGGISTATTAR
jgi:hypothetical protein